MTLTMNLNSQIYLNEWISSLRISRDGCWWWSTTDVLAQSQLHIHFPTTNKQDTLLKETIRVDETSKWL